MKKKHNNIQTIPFEISKKRKIVGGISLPPSFTRYHLNVITNVNDSYIYDNYLIWGNYNQEPLVAVIVLATWLKLIIVFKKLGHLKFHSN